MMRSMPKSAPSLHTDLLRGVSRSFYLTLRAVPGGLRHPLGLGYLLARATDTLADTAQIPPDVRVEALEGFCAAIEGGERDEVLDFLREEIAPLQTHASEKELVLRADECLAALDATAAADRDSIRHVLRHITRGQLLDLARFGSGGDRLVALHSGAELEEYAYLVAGSVGEFWTELGFRHERNYARLPEAEMMTLAVRFGKALQLINILRDLPVDVADGRCYLPSGELLEHGVHPEMLREDVQKALPVRDAWIGTAREFLGDAWKYTLAANSTRVRFACALPILIGFETLDLLEKQPITAGVKVDRKRVKRIAKRTAMRAWNRPWLAHLV